MGGKQLLRKGLGTFSLTNIVIANMIGAGIFTTSGLLLGQLASPVLLVVLWGVGGTIAFCGAWSYSELGSTFPEAGGEYIFLTRIFGPLLGFLSGWVSFVVGFSAPLAASALAFSEYFIRVFPVDSGFVTLGMVRKGIAIGIIILLTGVHYAGLHAGTRVQNGLTLLKIVLIVILIVTGFIFGEGQFRHFIYHEDHPVGWEKWKAAGLSLMWIMFAFSGWNASTYVGSEIKAPTRNIPRSLLIGTLVVTLLYLALNVLYIYAVPPREMKGVISIGGLAANNLFNRTLDRFFSLFIALVLLSSISALILIGPRVYYAMAQSGHFFKPAGRINRFNVPGVSIIMQSVLACVFILSGTFEQIITFLSFSLGIFPVIAVVGIFSLRRKRRSGLKLAGFPFIQLFFILMSVAVLSLSYMERPLESSLAIGVILLGIPVYFYLRERRKRIEN